MAYVRLPISNASRPCARPSSAKPSSPPWPSVAEPAASSSPFSCTRITCTPLSLREATIEYVRPPISKKSEAWALPSLSKPSWPSEAEPSASIVPLSWIRSSCTWERSRGVTIASVLSLPSGALSVETNMARSRRAGPPLPLVAEPTAARVPLS